MNTNQIKFLQKLDVSTIGIQIDMATVDYNNIDYTDNTYDDTFIPGWSDQHTIDNTKIFLKNYKKIMVFAKKSWKLEKEKEKGQNAWKELAQEFTDPLGDKIAIYQQTNDQTLFLTLWNDSLKDMCHIAWHKYIKILPYKMKQLLLTHWSIDYYYPLMFEVIKTYKHGEYHAKFSSYFYTAAKHRRDDLIRRSNTQYYQDIVDIVAIDVDTTNDMYESQISTKKSYWIDNDVLDDMMRHDFIVWLDDKTRDIVRLYYIGYTQQDIADKYNISLRTIKRIFSRLRDDYAKFAS